MSAEYEIPAELADFLAAVVETLDVPLPADYSDVGLRAHRDALHTRAFLAQMHARRILERAESSPGVAWETQMLRRAVADDPIRYTPRADGGDS